MHWFPQDALAWPPRLDLQGIARPDDNVSACVPSALRMGCESFHCVNHWEHCVHYETHVRLDNRLVHLRSLHYANYSEKQCADEVVRLVVLPHKG